MKTNPTPTPPVAGEKKKDEKVKEYVERARKFIDENWLNDGGSPEWFAWLQSPQGITWVAKMIYELEKT